MQRFVPDMSSNLNFRSCPSTYHSVCMWYICGTRYNLSRPQIRPYGQVDTSRDRLIIACVFPCLSTSTNFFLSLFRCCGLRCCGQEPNQIQTMLDNIDQCRAQQLIKLQENYTLQVTTSLPTTTFITATIPSTTNFIPGSSIPSTDFVATTIPSTTFIATSRPSTSFESTTPLPRANFSFKFDSQPASCMKGPLVV